MFCVPVHHVDVVVGLNGSMEDPPPRLGDQIVQHLETPLAVMFAVARSGAHDSNLILLVVEPLAADLLDVIKSRTAGTTSVRSRTPQPVAYIS